MKKKKPEDPEHVISQRAVDALRTNESAPREGRRELSRGEIEKFLQLVSRVQSPALFKRKLNMSAHDVEFYKRELGIANEDDARKELRRMKHEDELARERNIVQNRLEQREAEQIANERLQQMERDRAERLANREEIDVKKIREDEAAKQRRFATEQASVEEARKSDWRLPLEGNKTTQAAQIDLFRRDVVHHGMGFCLKKYGCAARDIKAEATRLGLKVNWDLVRR